MDKKKAGQLADQLRSLSTEDRLLIAEQLGNDAIDVLRQIPKRKGKAKVLRPCSWCKKKFGTREMWVHRKECPKRPEGVGAGRPPGTDHKPIKWTPEALALLGTDLDKIVAGKIGASVQVVYQKRKSLGIPSFSR